MVTVNQPVLSSPNPPRNRHFNRRHPIVNGRAEKSVVS
jgi:hypothetical protein